MPRKRYGQFCALARALDHVGDRWTLLVVRELLLGPKRYTDLVRALPGIATNLLAERLRELQASGVATVDGDGAYALTDQGRGLEPVVFALIRWGASFMLDGPGRDHVDPTWGRLALRALLDDDDLRSPRGEVQVEVEGGEPLTVRLGRSGRHVVEGPAARPGAVVRAPLDAVLAAAGAGARLPARSVRGDRSLAAAALAPTAPAG